MITKILILSIIVFIKAIFSAGDTALTYVNKAKISQMSKTNKKAKKIKILSENTTRFYGIIEVVITMCELLASAYAAEAFVTPLSIFLVGFHLSTSTAIILSIFIVTLILSYFLLIFGGILPKRIARSHPEDTIFHIVPILWFVSILNKPFEVLVQVSTNFFCKLFHLPQEQKEKLTEKEIKMIIKEGNDQGVIAKIEKDILLRTLKFNDLLVKDIMIPKEKIDFINIDDPIDKILNNIKKYNYTRMPVFEKTKDHVIGLFNIKDIIITYAAKHQIDLHIDEFLRPILFVHEKDKISDTFQTMQKQAYSLSIVLDDKEKVVGMLTMEDILEILVGNIIDEYDK